MDQVKLDRSFMRAITDGPRSLALARGIMALADELDIEVVAEGVATPEQSAALHEAGFRLVQGYLLGKPAPIWPDGYVHVRHGVGT